MNAARPDARTIFGQALEIEDAAAREAHVRQTCGDRPEVRAEVEALLRAHDLAGAFLEPPAANPRTVDYQPVAEEAGSCIGPYKLREQIGEGGMGVVFVAEQEHPVRRKVALKIIKPGMDTKEVIARFEAERQALALMDHTNIARVLDAGSTESGRPYFVMELVHGVPITEYCDANRLTPRQRLELFMPVCHAIQHAHHKGIIHRDIKPSNVLVTMYDDRPVPKVIDFGVAKAIDQRLTEKTVYTQFGALVGTFEYMSPEQAEMNAFGVDTRSDVYSLGVLLYELLTGTTPLERQRLCEAGYGEIIRLIKEEEPPRPSVRLSTSNTLAKIAAARRTEPGKLSQLVRGDLDWIVLKALEKDRTRRYQTPNALAADVDRHLSDETVSARPPSVGYRLEKFVRRNKLAVTMAVLVTTSLLLGIAGMAWKAREAQILAQELQQKNTELEAVAKQAHELVIERALLHAINGELDQVEATLAKYESRIDVKEKWLPTLRGAAHVHRGENKKAIEILKAVVEESPNNVAAVALLSVVYVHEGYWAQGLSLANRLRHLEPRGAFQDFDLLFKGYAYLYLDPERSEQLLRQVIQRHPSWIVARAIRSGALLHYAEAEQDAAKSLEACQEAIEEMKLAQAVVKENALVTMVHLFACKEALELFARKEVGRLLPAGKSMGDPREEGKVLADRLIRTYPDYIAGTCMAAQFYDTIGERKMAAEAWMRVLSQGAGFWAAFAIAHYYADNTSEETLRTIETLVRYQGLEVSIAKAYILADLPARRKEARAIYDSLIRDNTPFHLRLEAVDILLLLGEYGKAHQECSKWIQQSEQILKSAGDTRSSLGDEESLKLIANWGRKVHDGREDPNQGLANIGRGYLSRTFHRKYQQGLLALSQGDTIGAWDYFAECSDIGMVDLRYYWVRAFMAKLRQCPQQWPRGNRALHPEIVPE